jgi:hypothetical protein
LRRQDGLAVLEICIALVLVVAVCGTTFLTISKAHSIVLSNQAATRATALLNRKMNELRTQSFSALVHLPDDTGTELVGHPPLGLKLTWHRTVARNAPEADVLLIKYAVEWAENGRSRRLEASSSFSRNPSETQSMQVAAR